MAIEPQRECFIVGVIGKPDTEQRIHADWFIDGIVSPVFKEHFQDFKVIRADRMNTPGIITSQIIDKLLSARLVIADMSFLNANAFYEIGIRHMAGLPIIHAHREGEPIPFDVSTFLSMPYSLAQHQHVEAAKASLRLLVDNVLAENYTVENPVTQARGRAKFAETATPADKLLEQELETLKARMVKLENSPNRRAYVVDSWQKTAAVRDLTPPPPPTPITFFFYVGKDTSDHGVDILQRMLNEAMSDYIAGITRNGRTITVEYYPHDDGDAVLENITKQIQPYGITGMPF